jgi:hypothetical protein
MHVQSPSKMLLAQPFFNSHNATVIFRDNNRPPSIFVTITALIGSNVPRQLREHRLRNEVVVSSSFAVHVVFRCDLVRLVHALPAFQTARRNLSVAVTHRFVLSALGLSFWPASSPPSSIVDTRETSSVCRMNPYASASIVLIPDIR